MTRAGEHQVLEAFSRDDVRERRDLLSRLIHHDH